MDWKKLDELKQMTQTADEFGPVWKFFFDHLGENPEFMNLGRPTKNKLVTKLIKETLKATGQAHLNKQAVLVSNLLLIEIPKRGFYHGPAMVDDHMASLFYFEDLKMGMISLAKLGSGWVHYSRFTTLGIAGGGKNVNIQSGNQTAH